MSATTVRSYQIITGGYYYTYYGNGLPVTSSLRTGNASAEYLGGGIFISAGHVQDYWSSTTEEYKESSLAIGAASLNFLSYPGMYIPKNMAYDSPNTPEYDMGLYSAPGLKSMTDPLSPLIAFADSAAATAFLQAHNQITQVSAGPGNGLTGTYTGVPADGQFTAAMAIDSGDSGGAATVTVDGTQYIAGISSASYGSDSQGAPKPPSIFTYITAVDYSEINTTIPAGTNFGGIQDLIEGRSPDDYVASSGRAASIIVDGSNNDVLTGVGGGIVNAEVALNDVLYLPSSVGNNDPGTTVVASAGNLTIVGASSSDKLVILTDRFGDFDNDTGNSNLSETASTVQLLGGYGVSSNDYVATTGSDTPTNDIDGIGNCLVSYSFSDGGDDLVLNIAYGQDILRWSGSITIKNYQVGDFGALT